MSPHPKWTYNVDLGRLPIGTGFHLHHGTYRNAGYIELDPSRLRNTPQVINRVVALLNTEGVPR